MFYVRKKKTTLGKKENPWDEWAFMEVSGLCSLNAGAVHGKAQTECPAPTYTVPQPTIAWGRSAKEICRASWEAQAGHWYDHLLPNHKYSKHLKKNHWSRARHQDAETEVALQERALESSSIFQGRAGVAITRLTRGQAGKQPRGARCETQTTRTTNSCNRRGEDVGVYT